MVCHGSPRLGLVDPTSTDRASLNGGSRQIAPRECRGNTRVSSSLNRDPQRYERTRADAPTLRVYQSDSLAPPALPTPAEAQGPAGHSPIAATRGAATAASALLVALRVSALGQSPTDGRHPPVIPRPTGHERVGGPDSEQDCASGNDPIGRQVLLSISPQVDLSPQASFSSESSTSTFTPGRHEAWSPCSQVALSTCPQIRSQHLTALRQRILAHRASPLRLGFRVSRPSDDAAALDSVSPAQASTFRRAPQQRPLIGTT
jgi:hypothetical protein